MQPLIRHRQRCTIAPLAEQSLRIRDIVLCTVGGRDYLHLITAIRGEQYLISSNRGRVNGWITRNGIHGVLTGKE